MSFLGFLSAEVGRCCARREEIVETRRFANRLHRVPFEFSGSWYAPLFPTAFLFRCTRLLGHGLRVPRVTCAPTVRFSFPFFFDSLAQLLTFDYSCISYENERNVTFLRTKKIDISGRTRLNPFRGYRKYIARRSFESFVLSFFAPDFFLHI